MEKLQVKALWTLFNNLTSEDQEEFINKLIYDTVDFEKPLIKPTKFIIVEEYCYSYKYKEVVCISSWADLYLKLIEIEPATLFIEPILDNRKIFQIIKESASEIFNYKTWYELPHWLQTNIVNLVKSYITDMIIDGKLDIVKILYNIEYENYNDDNNIRFVIDTEWSRILITK